MVLRLPSSQCAKATSTNPSANTFGNGLQNANRPAHQCRTHVSINWHHKNSDRAIAIPMYVKLHRGRLACMDVARESALTGMYRVSLATGHPGVEQSTKLMKLMLSLV